jgi:hypothetical protein
MPAPVALSTPAIRATPATQTPPATTANRWRDFLLHAAIIVLAGLWIYSPAYHGDWLWDDDQLITANATSSAAYCSGHCSPVCGFPEPG